MMVYCFGIQLISNRVDPTHLFGFLIWVLVLSFCASFLDQYVHEVQCYECSWYFIVIHGFYCHFVDDEVLLKLIKLISNPSTVFICYKWQRMYKVENGVKGKGHKMPLLQNE